MLNESAHQLVALKVLRADSTKGGPNQPKEAEILEHIAQADPTHPGYQHVIKVLDSFLHVGPNGEHSCIVFEALGESVLNLQKRSENSRLSLELVRSIARQTLLGLDYIHRTCGLVHTGIYSFI
jgi:serine/threonine-protein kinase SRPK3